MNNDQIKGSAVLDVLGDQFLLLMGNLVQGNMKRALRYAETAGKEVGKSGLNIASQGLIEDLAQAQALKSSVINSPSIVPGIGTFLSFWLLGVENFFLLDQSVTLIIALCRLHGVSVEDRQVMERFAVEVVGEVFGIGTIEKKEDFRAISREYVTKTLPMKYVNSGMNSGMRKLLRRLLPFRSRSRLLPAGIGLGASALSAYEMLVNIGQTTLKNIPNLIRETSDKA